MRNSADVVVVGAGIIGSSVAYNLARLGVRDVLLLERDGVAAHASRLSAGLVRTHYSNAPEARLALAGTRWFENWSEMVGGDCGFVRTGLINLVTRSDHDKLRRNLAVLREVGVDTHLVGPEELVELEPDIRVAEDELAAYEPRSGYADPAATTHAMADAARRLGAELREGVEVIAIRTRGDRVAGVETSAGPVETSHVVLANGAWSVPLAGAVGVELPIRALAIRLAFVHRPSTMRPGRAGHAVVLDRAHGAYTRPEEDDLSLVGLVAFRDLIADPGAYDVGRDPDFERQAIGQVAVRFPGFAGASVARARSGPIDMTPDGCAIIDRAGPEGLLLAVGMSGSGFKKGPAIGACVAEMIVEGGARTSPVHAFRLGRFRDRDPIVSDGYAIAPESAAVLGPDSMVH
ncbi:MAG TPA: FAD-binding oxidoreductase [Candidatus Dormibacteraeota bacterium]